MKNKTFAAIALTGSVVSLLLAGCGSSAGTTASDSSSPTAAASAADTVSTEAETAETASEKETASAEETAASTESTEAPAESTETPTEEAAGAATEDTASEEETAGAGETEDTLSKVPTEDSEESYLVLAGQGVFTSGGTVTDPLPGDYDPTQSFMDASRAGNTAHVDHANVFYEIPAEDNGNPIVYLHGYGQSRTGWLFTPDGREGWAQIFLKNGHAAYLVDQPRRGEAGATATMTEDALDAEDDGQSKDYLAGDQAWYTHFRIGRVAPERYEGSQFPEGEDAQDEFFREMTPNTGSFDMALTAEAMGDVLQDVYDRTGEKSIYLTHSQGGAIGWETPVENISAIVAIEPGGTPGIGSDEYNRLLEADIPIVIYFGDYIDNGPDDLMSTAFWKAVRDGAVEFAEQYTEDGGDATVVNLPDKGITGNSHFMFEERNNDVIAADIEEWLGEHGLN